MYVTFQKFIWRFANCLMRYFVEDIVCGEQRSPPPRLWAIPDSYYIVFIISLRVQFFLSATPFDSGE